VDVGVYDTIADFVKGKFHGGTDRVFSLKDHGVGLGSVDKKVPASIKAAEKKTEAAIISGKLKPPTK
jgi:basic membrane lipoprotein Med (substrate-binding protein (PBP1-ABC) superfamily)